MNFEQMKKRCPGSKFLGPVKLANYKFIFDGYSKTRNGAVANIIESPGNFVWGGLFEISDANLAALDCYEGYISKIYDQKQIRVLLNGNESGGVDDVVVYLRVGEKPDKPSQEYKDVVLQGAKDCVLPVEYINYIVSLCE